MTVRSLREQLGNDRVVLGLSGGVDSSVAAILLDRAIGSNLTSIFVDNGLLRKNEYEAVLEAYRKMGLNVRGVDASVSFIDELKGVSDPEKKRRIIGRVFIEVFLESDPGAVCAEAPREVTDGDYYNLLCPFPSSDEAAVSMLELPDRQP